jgi:hypothetical protein
MDSRHCSEPHEICYGTENANRNFFVNISKLKLITGSDFHTIQKNYNLVKETFVPEVSKGLFEGTQAVKYEPIRKLK